MLRICITTSICWYSTNKESRRPMTRHQGDSAACVASAYNEWSYRSDSGHRLKRILDTVSVGTQVNVDCFNWHFQHGEDVLSHLTVRTVSLGEHDNTMFIDHSMYELIGRLNPTRQRRQHRPHSLFHTVYTLKSVLLEPDGYWLPYRRYSPSHSSGHESQQLP